jgi:hypothetical protein
MAKKTGMGSFHNALFAVRLVSVKTPPILSKTSNPAAEESWPPNRLHRHRRFVLPGRVLPRAMNSLIRTISRIREAETGQFACRISFLHAPDPPPEFSDILLSLFIRDVSMPSPCAAAPLHDNTTPKFSKKTPPGASPLDPKTTTTKGNRAKGQSVI